MSNEHGRDYIYSQENMARLAYGVGFDGCANLIMEHLEITYRKDRPRRLELEKIINDALDKYYERSGNGVDAKNRVLAADRFKIKELVRRMDEQKAV